MSKTIRGWWAWNRYYFASVNMCDNTAMLHFFDNVLINCKDGFKRRCYFWNWVRGKSFYISASRYVIENIRGVMNNDAEDPAENLRKAEQMIHEILDSTKDEKTRRSFVWNIGKAVPFLTIDTIRYLSSERIGNILSGEDHVCNDAYLQPFIRTIQELRQLNDELQANLMN